MKMNYKKVNYIFDLLFTVGIAIAFMVIGLRLNNMIYNVISFTYGFWIFALWTNDIVKKVRQREPETETPTEECNTTEVPNVIPAC